MKVSVFDNPEKLISKENVLKVIDKLNSLGIEVADSMSDSDVVIAVGGDGTILHVARKAAFLGKPVLGINFGRMGFTSSLEKSELDMLKKLLSKDYVVEHRIMLKVSVNNYTFFAINDVVVTKGILSKMIDIGLSCGAKVVSQYRADGVIICTPTGSTAYSLSAGGAVIDPNLSCMMVTPVCPHMRFSCPIVFGDKTILKVKAYSRNDDKAFVCVDGENVMSVDQDDLICVSVSDVLVSFVKFKDKTFFEVLNTKLNVD